MTNTGQSTESCNTLTSKTCGPDSSLHGTPTDKSLSRKGPHLTTEIKGDYIIVNDLRYSRKGAEAGYLGTVGKLMHPLGIPPIVHFQEPPPKSWTKNNVKMETIADITSEQSSQWGLSAKVSYNNVSGEGSLSISGSHSA